MSLFDALIAKIKSFGNFFSNKACEVKMLILAFEVFFIVQTHICFMRYFIHLETSVKNRKIVHTSVHRVQQQYCTLPRPTVNYTDTFTIMEMWTLLSKLEGGKVLRPRRESIEKIVKI